MADDNSEELTEKYSGLLRKIANDLGSETFLDELNKHKPDGYDDYTNTQLEESIKKATQLSAYVMHNYILSILSYCYDTLPNQLSEIDTIANRVAMLCPCTASAYKTYDTTSGNINIKINMSLSILQSEYVQTLYVPQDKVDEFLNDFAMFKSALRAYWERFVVNNGKLVNDIHNIVESANLVSEGELVTNIADDATYGLFRMHIYKKVPWSINIMLWCTDTVTNENFFPKNDTFSEITPINRRYHITSK